MQSVSNEIVEETFPSRVSDKDNQPEGSNIQYQKSWDHQHSASGGSERMEG